MITIHWISLIDVLLAGIVLGLLISALFIFRR